MSTRTILVGLLAVAAGAAAAVGARQMAQQWEENAEEGTNVVTVALAVPRGEQLGREQLTVERWPNDRVPKQALEHVDDAIGRVALAPMYKGQPVSDSLLASRDTPAGLASLIPDGMRAFTIQTPTIASGVGGFVLPGNMVDVLLTIGNSYAIRKDTGGGVTITLLQRVEILAVDHNLDAPAENRVDAKKLKSVTLLVSPEQAGKLSLAQNKGVLELALRNPGDESPVLADPITVADLQYLGELPLEQPKETDEERINKLLAERMAQREAELAVERVAEMKELKETLQAEARLALEEELQREMAKARADLAKLQPVVQARPIAKPKVPQVLTIRTLRGTHSGIVRIQPATANPTDTSMARRLGD